MTVCGIHVEWHALCPRSGRNSELAVSGSVTHCHSIRSANGENRRCSESDEPERNSLFPHKPSAIRWLPARSAHKAHRVRGIKSTAEVLGGSPTCSNLKILLKEVPATVAVAR
jgi:hypothetical protein